MIDLTILVMIFYFILLILVGMLLKSSRGSDEYCLAKKSLSVTAIAAGLVMTHYGGGLILGGAELGYQYGAYGLVYGASASLGILFLGLLFSKKIVQEGSDSNIKTIPSLLYKKFNSRKIATLSAILSIISLIAIASAQIFASVKIFSALNVPIMLSGAIITLIIALVATKGMNALTRFGKFNLLLASIGAIAALFIAFNIPTITENQKNFESMSLNLLFWIAIPTIFYTLIGQDFHQKLYCTKSVSKIKMACIFSSVFLLFLSLFPVMIGIKSHYLFDIPPPEALPKFLIFILPSFLKGLFIAAILAAVIGSAQSVINAASTQISEDLIKPFAKFSDEKLGKIASCSAFFISILAFIIAIFSSSIIGNIVVAYTIYTSGMFLPVIIAFFSNQTKRFSKLIFFTSLIGILSAIAIETKIIKIFIPTVVISTILSSIFFLGGLIILKNEHRR